MTRKELAAIKERCEKATVGPWEDSGRPMNIFDRGMFYMGSGLEQWQIMTPSVADAEFIAHARSDVPALVEEVERLRGLMSRLCQIADDCEGDETAWAYGGYEFVDKDIRAVVDE